MSGGRSTLPSTRSAGDAQVVADEGAAVGADSWTKMTTTGRVP